MKWKTTVQSQKNGTSKTGKHFTPELDMQKNLARLLQESGQGLI